MSGMYRIWRSSTTASFAKSRPTGKRSDLKRALTDDEVERRAPPHVKAFYTNYMDPARHEPFYRPSSRA